MDKRNLGEMFRERLEELVSRYNGSQADFSREIGIDRSALSQLLSSNISRLPRAETLRNLAETQQVSLDWLLGLSNSEARGTQIEHTTAVEGVMEQANSSRLAQWHSEAEGYKIRYVPAWIPDLLCTPDIVALFSGERPGLLISDKLQGTNELLDYSRKPETDMEVCMPVQRLISLHRGEGIWAELNEQQRSTQLDLIERLTQELYPTFRLFLYDQKSAYSAPYTVFGPKRAAIYVRDMYVMINGTDHIRALTRHFDELIRRATINPHEVANFIKDMRTRP